MHHNCFDYAPIKWGDVLLVAQETGDILGQGTPDDNLVSVSGRTL